MGWSVITWTAIIASKLIDIAAYGHDLHTGSQDTSRPSTSEFGEKFYWDPELFYAKAPQTDINANNFRPQLPFGEMLQKSLVRRRQLGGGVNNRPNLFLPPAADDPDDIFIFDRPTSSRPRPGGNDTPFTTPSTTTTTAANCDCPSTPEFNPVCGSDGVTYTNPGKLKCSIFCGTAVNLKHYGSCLSTTEPPMISPGPSQ